MKPTLATIIAAAIILVVMTGGFAMNRMMSTGDHANCFLSIPKCIGLDPVRFATMHINALLNLSLGIIGSFAILFAILLLIAWRRASDMLKVESITPGYSKVFAEGRTKSIHKQRYWLSLLEKRDPSLFCAVNT